MQAKFLNDQLIAYRHRPSCATTIVFANSLGADQSIWDGVVAQLGGGFGILTYDLRGHGLSGVSQEEFGIEDLADDLIALIEHEQLKNVVICGVSVGGMIAQAVAARNPTFLRGIILSNTAAKVGTQEHWNERIDKVNSDGLDAIADSILEKWFSEGFCSRAATSRELARNILCRTAPKGYVAICAAIRDADLTELASKIKTPTLCVAGLEDSAVPVDDVQKLADRISGARFVTLDRTGHIPSLEEPDVIADLIEDFARPEMSRLDRGMAARRAVLGAAHVEDAEAAKTSFDTPFQTLVSETAWGTVWSSNAISQRERSMITLSLLAALGNFNEIPMHVRATQRTGASERDIAEAFQHVALYAGVPRANHALKLAKETLAEMESDSDG